MLSPEPGAVPGRDRAHAWAPGWLCQRSRVPAPARAPAQTVLSVGDGHRAGVASWHPAMQPAWAALWHSLAQHGTVQHSSVQHSTAQHSAAQCSSAQRSSAQSSTAQLSSAQLSTARHSAAQHREQEAEREAQPSPAVSVARESESAAAALQSWRRHSPGRVGAARASPAVTPLSALPGGADPPVLGHSFPRDWPSPLQPCGATRTLAPASPATPHAATGTGCPPWCHPSTGTGHPQTDTLPVPPASSRSTGGCRGDTVW